MKMRWIGMMVFGLLVVQTSVMGGLVNVAPGATYVYPTDWPNSPSLWTDPDCTKLNDGNMTNLVAPAYSSNICAIFDLGQDMEIAELTAFASDNQYNKLNKVTFYVNTESQGGWTTYAGVQTANWSQEISTVDKTDSIWTVGTGVRSTAITGRYVAMRTYASEYPSVKAISEIGIYSVPEPLSLAVMGLGGWAMLRSRRA